MSGVVQVDRKDRFQQFEDLDVDKEFQIDGKRYRLVKVGDVEKGEGCCVKFVRGSQKGTNCMTHFALAASTVSALVCVGSFIYGLRPIWEENKTPDIKDEAFIVSGVSLAVSVGTCLLNRVCKCANAMFCCST